MVAKIGDTSLFPTIKKKRKANFSINANVLEQFNKLAEKNSWNKSGVVEKLLESLIKEENKK